MGRTDPLIEGVWADEYAQADPRRQIIARDYRDRYCQLPTPLSDPQLFDPLSPPQGWRYDPYWECWIKL
jgi:hypothetical protein